MINIVSINNNTPYTYENNGGLAQLGERLNGIQAKVCHYHFDLFFIFTSHPHPLIKYIRNFIFLSLVEHTRFDHNIIWESKMRGIHVPLYMAI